MPTTKVHCNRATYPSQSLSEIPEILEDLFRPLRIFMETFTFGRAKSSDTWDRQDGNFRVVGFRPRTRR